MTTADNAAAELLADLDARGIIVCHESGNETLTVLTKGTLPPEVKKTLRANKPALIVLLCEPATDVELQAVARAGRGASSLLKRGDARLLARLPSWTPPPLLPELQKWDELMGEMTDGVCNGKEGPITGMNGEFLKDPAGPATQKQLALLRKHGVGVPKRATKGQCSYVIDRLLATEPATERQIWCLKQHGYEVREGMTKREASDAISELKGENRGE
jgi:hypothetical protein